MLFASEKVLTVVTAQAPSGLMYYTSIMAEDPPDARWPNARRSYRVMLRGPGEPNRRSAIWSLLDETERMIYKQVLRK